MKLPMNYIIKHDFNQEIPYYVRLVNTETFEEVYNPSFATTFSTKKAAKDWVDTYSSMSSHSKIVDASKAIIEYEEWAKGGTVRRILSCINTSMSRPYNGESLSEVIDWWVHVNQNEDEIKFEHYTTWPKLYSISKHLSEVNGYHNKDYTEQYVSFEIYTRQDGKFEDFEKELNMILDKVTLKDDDGYLILPIFDHYLSECGNSVYLLIHPETNKVKIDGRYSWNNSEFDSLQDAFEYMKRERYYE